MAHHHTKRQSPRTALVSTGCLKIEAFETQTTFAAWACIAKPEYSKAVKSRIADGRFPRDPYGQHAEHVHRVWHASHEYRALHDSSAHEIDLQKHDAYAHHLSYLCDCDARARSASQPQLDVIADR